VTDAAAPAAAPIRAVWERIKHHKVVQWTLAYLALAYTLLHSAEMLGNSLGWSHGLLRLFTLLLILGVPVVIIVSWYHGARGQRRVSGTELMIIAILLAMGGTFLWRDSKTEHAAESAASATGEHGSETGAQKLTTAAPAPPAASIAVLAFSDLSAEGNQGYFSDGIAEEILNVLAHVKGLKVASRTSSFQLRKSDLGAPAIAQKLGVRHILEGSVRKAGDTVRITAQLIDASADQHVWSETFDRPLSTANLFAIQDEIAKSIVDHLAATMGSAADVAGAPTARKADTADEDAYDLYLKGRSLFIARSKQNLIAAAGALKAAVAKDPKFARAWEMLGAVLVAWKYWDVGDESDHQAGSDALDKALRLDPNLSLAYAVRGELQVDMVPSRGAAGWDDASASFSRAIEHDGTNATAYLLRGEIYMALGYQDRAIQDYQRTLDIDPAYEFCRLHLAMTYLYLGRTDDALRLSEIGLENGYFFDEPALASAVAARGDRFGALSILARVYQDDPQLIRPLFRALTDPRFSEHDRQDALALVNRAKNSQNLIPSALLMLKAYDKIIADNTDPPIWWAHDDEAWLNSQSRKRAMQYWHLPEYWRKHGFPPQCRPVGESDFECR
jgi:TolB-like protein/Tfp pilus assembly protein PilF